MRSITLGFIQQELGPYTFWHDLMNPDEELEKQIESKIEGLYNAMYKEACVVRRYVHTPVLLPVNYEFHTEDVIRLFNQLRQFLKELEEKRPVVQVLAKDAKTNKHPHKEHPLRVWVLSFQVSFLFLIRQLLSTP